MSLVDDINNLDTSNPGVWPLPFQLVTLLIILVLIVFAGYKMDVSKQRIALTEVEGTEVGLKEVFEAKQAKAANLEALKEQMREMEQSFGDMIRQLPNKTEVAGLIIDVSQTGLAAGLEFDLFQPAVENVAEFYAELPINIRVQGDYHQLGEFISGVAGLPRIVTTHNISITEAGSGSLIMAATAKTYRALEEEE